MTRFSLFAFLLLFAAVMLLPQATPSATPKVKPTPVGLQYDEITRTAIPPATPPPPGSFGSDYAAVLNPPPADENQPDAEAAAMMKRMGIKMPDIGMMQGALSRYAFYKGWIRVDDIVRHTAEIRKCNLHQFIQIDLNKKTYRITSEAAKTSGAETAAGNSGISEDSGTMQMIVSRKGTSLGPMTLEGIATNGYRETNSMSMAKVTGSCRQGSISTVQTEYVSGFHQPSAYCPLNAPMGMPGAGSSMGGCKPTFKYANSGSAAPQDRLVMYSKTAMLQPGNTDESSSMTAFVTERGNVKVLFKADAESLFTVPADFAREP